MKQWKQKATVSGFNLNDGLPLVDLSYIATWTRNEGLV